MVLALATLLDSAVASRARASVPSWLDLFGRLELAGAFPLAAPQNKRFYPGFQGLANVGFGFPWLDIKLTGHLQILPAKESPGTGEAMVLGGLGGGLRIKLPYDLFAVSPFIEADLLYARTSTLNRFAYTLALGAHFPVGEERQLRLGPVLRFVHVTNADRPGFDDRDAYVFTVGVSGEYGMPIREPLPPPDESAP